MKKTKRNRKTKKSVEKIGLTNYVVGSVLTKVDSEGHATAVLRLRHVRASCELIAEGWEAKQGLVQNPGFSVTMIRCIPVGDTPVLVG